MAIYRNTASYAREHGELDQYRASHWGLMDARNALEDILVDAFDGMHLDKTCIDIALEKLGKDAVEVIAVCTIRSKAWDGRFSTDNKQWAFSRDIGDAFIDRTEYAPSTHPTVFNGFVNLYRKAVGE